MDELELRLRALKTAAPEGFTAAVMDQVVKTRTFLGLTPRRWAYAAACLGGWAIAVRSVLAWTAENLGT